MNFASEYYDYLIDKTLNYSEDQYDHIKIHNEKSKEILEEYERIANEKRENNKKEENELIQELNVKKKELSILNEVYTKLNRKDFDVNGFYEKQYEMNEKIEELEEDIEDIESKIDKIKSRNVYPHGNGLFGFALLYYDISQKIGFEWKHPIYTWTILGYKAVYPRHAIDYIQYKKDIEKSRSLMAVIENKLRMNGKNIYELHEDVWIDEINNYLKDNNITIEDDIVFRPHKNNIFRNKQNEDDVQYYRITKTDLINSELECDDFDFEFFLNMEYESDEEK